MKVHVIKMREDGEGYSKGEIARAEFHGCAVDAERQEIAFLQFLDGARKGERLEVPFRVFRFHEGKEVESADPS